MAQPTGPQAPPPEAPPPDAPALRVAAGRDICRLTLREWQPGHSTSASSERRMMKASKVVPQDGQAYS
jgi:hypothetical protein